MSFDLGNPVITFTVVWSSTSHTRTEPSHDEDAYNGTVNRESITTISNVLKKLCDKCKKKASVPDLVMPTAVTDVGFSPASVCFSAWYLKNQCIQDHQTWHRHVPPWALETHYFKSKCQRSRSRNTKTVLAWIFALWPVLASCSLLTCQLSPEKDDAAHSSDDITQGTINIMKTAKWNWTQAYVSYITVLSET